MQARESSNKHMEQRTATAESKAVAWQLAGTIVCRDESNWSQRFSTSSQTTSC